jgi:hypothetical protein
MKTSQKIIKAAAEIEAALKTYPMPLPNQAIPNRIRFLAAQLSGCDRYAAENAYKIAELASIFYSARKHMEYNGGSDVLWTEMTIELINRIRNQAKSREAVGD